MCNWNIDNNYSLDVRLRKKKQNKTKIQKNT